MKKTETTNSRKTATKKTSKIKPETVRLPNAMPKRAVEKSHLLSTNLDEYLRKSALYVANIAGVCFLLVGLTLTSAAGLDAEIKQQLAQTLSTTDSTLTESNNTNIKETEDTIVNEVEDTSKATEETSTDDGVNFSVTLEPSPQYKLVTDIPDELHEELQVTFTARYTKSPDVFVRNIETDDTKSLSYNQNNSDTYSTILQADTYEPGVYQFVVVLRNLNDGTKHVHPSSRFLVPEIESEEVNETAVNNTVEDSVQIESETGDTEVAAETPIDDTVEQIDTAPTTEPVNDPLATNDLDDQETPKVFTLRHASAETLEGRITMVVIAPTELTDIQLYARPINGLRSQFVVRAAKGIDRWFTHFDSRNLPNGTYEFFAVATTPDGEQNSSSLVRSVANQTTMPSETETVSESPQAPTTNREPAPRPVRDVDTEPVREFRDTDFTTRDSSDAINAASDELLSENNDSLRDLLKRYAVAVQSGDETVVRLAEEALEKKRQELSLRALQNTRTTDIADSIDTRIAERVADAKERVATFERLRTDRTSGSAAVDTDGDGISDIDERVLYKTDPQSADTDGDGIPDGVEVAGGFDPLVPDTATQVAYESPKDTIGIEREDVLRVEQVAAVVEHSPDEDASETTAVISGRGLPNSIATLYIFSSPIVVTVRTDADGSFEYAFDKELSDGTHDVYVALTDNTGRIVAQSNPFTFVKEAQAFTPVEADSAAVSATPTVEPPQTYNVTIGLSVLSFGLILLMLGATLRKQPLISSQSDEQTSVS